MKHILKQGIDKGISYKVYRELVEKLVLQESTTGNEKTEALVQYTKLNDRRMSRWDKTLKIPATIKSQVEQFDDSVTWLVLTESWCGDAAHLIPVMNKIAELNSNIDLKLIFRDDHDDLMNLFLTHGSRSIPKLIAIDNTTFEVIDSYGPRPSVLTKMVEEFKTEHGKLTAEFKEELQRWYNKDKGQTTFKDLSAILSQVLI